MVGIFGIIAMMTVNLSLLTTLELSLGKEWRFNKGKTNTNLCFHPENISESCDLEKQKNLISSIRIDK
jgi:hypothetical protein